MEVELEWSLFWGAWGAWEHGNLGSSKGGAAILADSQNGDIIVLSFPHFFFNNDEDRG
jgi:hypothetical protein